MLSEARDQTHNLMVPSRIRFCCATTGTPNCCFLIYGQASRNGAQQILNTEPAAVKSESLLRRLYKFSALTAFWSESCFVSLLINRSPTYVNQVSFFSLSSFSSFANTIPKTWGPSPEPRGSTAQVYLSSLQSDQILPFKGKKVLSVRCRGKWGIWENAPLKSDTEKCWVPPGIWVSRVGLAPLGEWRCLPYSLFLCLTPNGVLIRLLVRENLSVIKGLAGQMGRCFRNLVSSVWMPPLKASGFKGYCLWIPGYFPPGFNFYLHWGHRLRLSWYWYIPNHRTHWFPTFLGDIFMTNIWELLIDASFILIFCLLGITLF